MIFLVRGSAVAHEVSSGIQRELKQYLDHICQGDHKIGEKNPGVFQAFSSTINYTFP